MTVNLSELQPGALCAWLSLAWTSIKAAGDSFRWCMLPLALVALVQRALSGLAPIRDAHAYGPSYQR